MSRGLFLLWLKKVSLEDWNYFVAGNLTIYSPLRSLCSTEIRLAATTALHNSIDFFKGNFEKEVWIIGVFLLRCRSVEFIDLLIDFLV
jgi:hypothetical protein